MLAFLTLVGCLEYLLALHQEEDSSESKHASECEKGKTHVCGRELLLSSDDCTTALCCVQGTLALDDGLTLSGARPTSFGSDLGDGVPLRHCVCD